MSAATRLTRAQQAQRNRERVLAAARDVFIANGFHGASLEQVANAAGFSKGVIYSQFESKADLFFALLERRIAERAAEQRSLAERLSGIEQYGDLIGEVLRAQREDPAWNLLLAEFRVLAARDLVIGDRYRAVHRRTIDGIAAALGLLYERSRVEPPAPVEQIAAAAHAFISGLDVEEAVHGALPPRFIVDAVGRLLGVPPGQNGAAR